MLPRVADLVLEIGIVIATVEIERGARAYAGRDHRKGLRGDILPLARLERPEHADPDAVGLRRDRI